MRVCVLMSTREQRHELALSDSVLDVDAEFLAHYYTLNSQAPWRLSLDAESSCYRIEQILSELATGMAPTAKTTKPSKRTKQSALSLTLDFRAGHYQHRQIHPSKEPLIQAVKIKKKLPECIIDATPGVLKDSLMLAGRGVHIIAIERNPILFVMVRQALAYLPDCPKIDYYFGDACDLLAQYEAPLIYLDPMYPPRANSKKGAQVKKDMQVLHHIIGADSDAGTLFTVARAQRARIVVKRPNYAEPIADETPSFVSQTGATRFDVYLPTDC